MLPSAPLKLNPLQATAACICKNAPSQQGGIFKFKFRSILFFFFFFFFAKCTKLLPDVTSIQTTNSRKLLQTLDGSLLRIEEITFFNFKNTIQSQTVEPLLIVMKTDQTSYN